MGIQPIAGGIEYHFFAAVFVYDIYLCTVMFGFSLDDTASRIFVIDELLERSR